MQPVYGLIGYPLAHSFSQSYFTSKFEKEQIDAEYWAFEISDISDLPGLLKENPGLRGLNVTIPYKRAIIPYLDELDDAAVQIGAVNCITIGKRGIKGYNTDIIGFEKSLEPLLQPHHRQALILGTGGSSDAVAYVLNRLDISCVKVSREKKHKILTYDEMSAEMIAQCKLIVNTTPLGMYPATETVPAIPYEGIGKDHLLYDLVYNPQKTIFLTSGEEKGATIKNGMEMLHLQAEASWEIWNR